MGSEMCIRDRHLRVRVDDYRLALLQTLEEDGAELVEEFQLADHLGRLRERLLAPERYSAAGKLTRGILDSIGADNPMQLSGEEFGQAAEGYYRRQLRTAYVREALGCVREDLQPIDGGGSDGDRRDRGLATAVIGPRSAVEVLAEAEEALVSETADCTTLRHCLALCLLTISRGGASSRRQDGRSLAS